MASTVLKTELHTKDAILNRAWTYLSNDADPFNVDDAILFHLRKSLQWLALNDVATFRKYASGISSLPHRTFGYLLLRSWAENPAEFANECAEYLAADKRRLNIGYSSWSGIGEGTGKSAISRLAIRAVSPHCTSECFQRLESTIIGYSDEYEKQNPRTRGYAELLLLRSLDQSRVAGRTTLRIEELERKFPQLSDAIVPERDTSLIMTSKSPIPSDTAQKMTDEQWISAMKKYDGSTDRFHGGPIELSSVLANFARRDRRRFAALVSRIPKNADPMYFSAILDGICGRHSGLAKDEKEADERDLAATETQLFLDVIDTLHSLPSRPCGSAIAGCIEVLSDREVQQELLDILSFYATSDPEPETDIWKQNSHGGNYHGGDPYGHGINCVRGQAAQAIAQLLYDDESRFDRLRPALESLANDPIISVRTCALVAYAPLLNYARDFGVRLFNKACTGCESICGTKPFDTFVYYAIHTHYPQLRELLQFALNSSDLKAVEYSARQIALAELGDVNVGGDDIAVRAGSEAMRRAVVGIYAHNLSHDEVGDKCAKRLEEFFNDEAESVRQEVSRAFFSLSGERLLQLKDFIARYIESKSFESETNRLLHALEESNVELPNVVCRAAERVLEFVGAEGSSVAHYGSMAAHSISTLIVRQYEQTTDQTSKIECLNLIDRMEQVGYYGIGDELSKIDR